MFDSIDRRRVSSAAPNPNPDQVHVANGETRGPVAHSASPDITFWEEKYQPPRWRDRFEPVIDEMLPSTAGRIGSHFPDGRPRQQHVSKRTNTSHFREPGTGRIYVAESGPEERAYLTAQADDNVVEIQDQPNPAIPYLDGEGKGHLHHMDYRFVLRSGDAIAIYGKYGKKADSPQHQEVVQSIANHMPPDFATRIEVVTEDTYPDWQVADARLIISVREDEWTDLHTRIAEHSLNLERPVTIEALADQHGGGIAFRPIARLIDDGILVRVEDTQIDRRCLVRAGARQQ